MDAISPSLEDKITLAVSPIKRAQDAFVLARYLNLRSHWPYFHITHVANECAILVTTRDGWDQLKLALDAGGNEVLSIASIEGNNVTLRMVSSCLEKVMADMIDPGDEGEDSSR